MPKSFDFWIYLALTINSIFLAAYEFAHDETITAFGAVFIATIMAKLTINEKRKLGQNNEQND